MDRRNFLTVALATLFTPALAQQAPTPTKTRWKVRSSIGFDALAFLGPLAGGELYLPHYRADAEAFAARMPKEIVADIAKLWKEAEQAEFGLLGPSLSVIFSSGHDGDLPSLMSAISSPESSLLPAYRASPYWGEDDWRWFLSAAPRLKAIFGAMHLADFTKFRAERAGDVDAKIGDLNRGLQAFDVIKLHEKLTGRTFDPEIEVVLLQFCKPHGIKVQGQTFLQATDWNIAITVRNAAHEMLHPPIPMDGAAAKAAMAALEKDPLFPKIVREHDPRWGYTTLDGLLNEDLTQALDQLISEALGVARNPADRWRRADDGIHVLAAAFYGLLRQDRWVETGGSIEKWLESAVRSGRLTPSVLHPVAARVLERPVDNLWSLPNAKG